MRTTFPSPADAAPFVGTCRPESIASSSARFLAVAAAMTMHSPADTRAIGTPDRVGPAGTWSHEEAAAGVLWHLGQVGEREVAGGVRGYRDREGLGDVPDRLLEVENPRHRVRIVHV